MLIHEPSTIICLITSFVSLLVWPLYLLILSVEWYNYTWSHSMTQTHTHTHTLSRTSVDEGSAHLRYLYQTTHNTHNRQTSMHPAGFEPAVSASERLQIYALDHVATSISGLLLCVFMWFQYDPAANQAVYVPQCFFSNSAVHHVILLANIIEAYTIVPQALTVLQTHSWWLILLNVPREAQVQIAVPRHQLTAIQLVDQSHAYNSHRRTNSTN